MKYNVVVRDKRTAKDTLWTANVIINAGGQFSKPKYANIPGRDTFQHEQLHTSQWHEGVELHGKRVAMIGTGPSTAQIAPEIQPLVKELILYQRSATYCVPRNDGPQSSWKKAIFRWIPFALHFYHIWWYLTVRWSIIRSYVIINADHE